MNYLGRVLDDGQEFVVVETAALVPLVDIKLTLGEFGTVEVSMCANQAREVARHLSEAAATISKRSA